LNGIINLLKPPMMTSGTAVAAVKRITGSQHVGHTGTLDPNAAGVLPIVVGRYTKLAEYFLAEEKEYTGEILFGIETDSCDTEGNVVNTSDVYPTNDDILSVLPEFLGEITQVPPTYSAIKINGKKAYELARESVQVEIPSRNVFIESITLLARTAPNRVTVHVKCSKGTYIRSLARDIGRRLGSCACLSMLVRTKCGDFDIDNSITIEQVEELFKSQRFDELFCDVNKALGHIKCAEYSTEWAKKLIFGNYVPLSKAAKLPDNINKEDTYRITVDGELICLAKIIKDERSNDVFQPTKVIAQ